MKKGWEMFEKLNFQHSILTEKSQPKTEKAMFEGQATLIGILNFQHSTALSINGQVALFNSNS